MWIDHPSPHHMPQQRSLWQTAFGDTDGFLDCFFRTAYRPGHCRCVLINEEIAAILYWIDCGLDGEKLAYIYAVVTHPDYRGQGLCRMLMEDTHNLLRSRGYAGTILVPQQEGLRKMYAGMGYRNIGGLTEFSCTAAVDPIPLRTIGPLEFFMLRKNLLPERSVLHGGDGLRFLSEQLQFYAGEGILLAAYEENQILHVPELLGPQEAAPGILAALGCIQGFFRAPGREKAFAMFHPLTASAIVPSYFGFSFD